MPLANCPMCQVAISAEQSQSIQTCGQCGADLSRWAGKSSEPQSSPVWIDPAPTESSRAARNGLYCLAGVWAIPAILMVVMVTKYGVKLDAVNLTFGIPPFVLCIMAVIAAVKCGAAKKSARIWAFLPVWVMMFCFPIGTIVAYMVHTRLGEAELN